MYDLHNPHEKTLVARHFARGMTFRAERVVLCWGLTFGYATPTHSGARVSSF